MNYYPFHIGDYTTHTAHLEALEDLAYRRCLDAYYLREGPLPPEVPDVARLVRMRAHESEVGTILREFFKLTDHGWEHERCADELARMLDKQAKAAASGRASAAARAARAMPPHDAGSTTVERAPDEGSTTNTNTNTNTKKNKTRADAPRFDARASLLSLGVGTLLAEEWLGFRKRRAPVTPTVLEVFQREAAKAGWKLDAVLRECIARGWTGFKADWVAPVPGRVSPADVARVTVPGTNEEDPALKKIREDEAKASKPSPEVLAQLAALKRKKPAA